MSSLAAILPKGEGFSAQNYGAISLCVRDFVLHSRWRDDTLVIGGVPAQNASFEGIRYQVPPRARWFQSRTGIYAQGCANILKTQRTALAEIHNRPHLVHLIAWEADCKLALHLHNDPQEMDDARTAGERRKLLALCGGIYCVSNYIRERFLEGLDESAKARVHVIYNGIEMPARQTHKEKLIVFAGRMTEGKGALVLAQALRIALPQMPQWRAVLIGARRHAASGTLSPYEKNVAQSMDALKPQAELLGFLPYAETLSYFARAHIAVVPSLWQEPFGRTALEAMAYGCATISSGSGGLHEVTQDAAVTLKNMTPELLAQALVMLAANDSERERLQQAAINRAAWFSISERTRALDNAREAILGSDYRTMA